MQVKAKTSKNFLFRMALLAVFLNGGALWFLYDGAIAWPKERVQALKYLEFKEKGEKEDEENKDNEEYESGQWKKDWKVYAADQGWSTDERDKPREEIEFMMQYVMAGIVAPFGILFLVILIRASLRWIEMDETGIRTSWGREFEFDQIVSLNKKQWRKKGIAKIFYDDNGRKRRVVLDDCKYDVEPTKAILIEVESRIGYDKITDGPPEAVERAEAETEEPAEQAAE